MWRGGDALRLPPQGADGDQVVSTGNECDYNGPVVYLRNGIAKERKTEMNLISWKTSPLLFVVYLEVICVRSKGRFYLSKTVFKYIATYHDMSFFISNSQ